MTHPVHVLLDRIDRGQIGTISILEELVEQLEDLANPLNAHVEYQDIASSMALAVMEVRDRVESMSSALYGLEDAVKVFDGDGRRVTKYEMPERLRAALLVHGSKTELEELRRRFGDTFAFTKGGS